MVSGSFPTEPVTREAHPSTLSVHFWKLNQRLSTDGNHLSTGLKLPEPKKLKKTSSCRQMDPICRQMDLTCRQPNLACRQGRILLG
ncbi:hypothetical protein Taro_049222 [Colocasia esculenta]|uniref:Uncharacterized protein n=1 Tax=Colocasia esculenta TaxID=4460 RepID=A0A843XAF3_COLES|nr:hypothetical protein [Colocasia esculenta]